MLSLDFNFVLEMINLVILYLLLRKFLIGPVMNIMEKRRAMIADGIQNANDQQARAMELKSQYEDALSGAKDESRTGQFSAPCGPHVHPVGHYHGAGRHFQEAL